MSFSETKTDDIEKNESRTPTMRSTRSPRASIDDQKGEDSPSELPTDIESEVPDVLGQEAALSRVLSTVQTEWRWEDDPENPYNWPKRKKNIQLITTASVGFAR
jgi:hypothetical protein